MNTLPDRLLACADEVGALQTGLTTGSVVMPRNQAVRIVNALREAAAALSGGEAVGARRRTMTLATSEREARELLAREYERDDPTMAKKIREGTCRNEESNRAIPAIIAALTREQREGCVCEDCAIEYDFTNATRGAILPQPQQEAPVELMKCICTSEGTGCTNKCDRGQLPPIPVERITITGTQQEAPGAVNSQLADEIADELAKLRPIDGLMRRDLHAILAIKKKLYTTPPAPVDVRVEALRNRFLSETSSLPEEWQDWREDFRRDIQALLDGQPAGVDAGENVRSYAEGDRVVWTSKFGRKFEGTVVEVIAPVPTLYEVSLDDGAEAQAFGHELAALGGGGGRG